MATKQDRANVLIVGAGEREIHRGGLMDLAQKMVEWEPIYRPTPTSDAT
jgi:hypothetical protein